MDQRFSTCLTHWKDLIHTRICIFIDGEVSVELVDVNVVPDAFQWDVGISVAVNNRLHDTDILVTPAALMEAKGPELLHCRQACTVLLELAYDFHRTTRIRFATLTGQEIEVEATA
jgi:hypothetical protein